MPDKVEVDFDHHSPKFARHNREILRDLQTTCPVAWTSAHGGYWVASDYDAVATFSRDDDLFASGKDFGNGVRRGVSIPETPGQAIPIETDPPEFYGYRRLLNPWFAPGAVAKLEPTIRDVADALVDRVIEAGRFDVVLALTNPLPAIMTLHILGLPIDDWARYAMPMHEIMYTPPGPEFNRVGAAYLDIAVAIVETIEQRRKDPKDDLLSYLAHADIDGRPLTDDELGGIVNLVIAGGVDTTTAVTSNALIYLSQNREARQQLIDDPERRKLACEEFLRYYSPIQALGRTITTDVEVKGQQLQAGERVLICWAGANQDPEMFENPDDVVLDRFPNKHTAFGLGLHRCVGSTLARAQILAMLDVVLERMPDYTVDEAGVQRYPSLAIVNGCITIPATFTPGPKVGSSFFETHAAK
jgi:cytochrome P450